MKQKLLASILIVAMLFSLVPAPVFASKTITVGDFTITSQETLIYGEDYTVKNKSDSLSGYNYNIVTISTEKAITIKNTNTSPTTDRIVVTKNVSANITFDGVNIDISNTIEGNIYGVWAAAFKIEAESTGDVTITLADGSKNILKSGAGKAGLEKGNYVSRKQGLLTIKGGEQGTGTLEVVGRAAGIGGSNEQFGVNITIDGAIVTATGYGGAGIGGGQYGAGSYINIINGSTVTAKGGYGSAGIGGGCDEGFTHDVRIVNSSVTAEGGMYAPGIGAGLKGEGRAPVVINSSVVTNNGEYYVYMTGDANNDTYRPLNDNEEKLYSLMIYNPNRKTVKIDGSVYGVTNHGNEEKLYAYVTGDTHTVEIDGLATEYSFNSRTRTFTHEHTFDVNKICKACGSQGFTVTFDNNGGTGDAMNSVVLTAQDPLPTCTFDAPAEKYFSGWSTNPGGVAISSVTADSTLYAIWRPIVKIIYDPNGGIGESKEVTHSQSVHYPYHFLEGCTFDAPEGQCFYGWSTSQNEEDIIGDYSIRHETDNDFMLYAIWGDVDDCVEMNDVNFPDINFRTAVAERAKDQDGYLCPWEISKIDDLYLKEKNIVSLKGIEYLTALEYLDCQNNKLTSLDISKNTSLIFLYCQKNQLTSLDLSNNTKLEGLDCSNNKLTVLNFDATNSYTSRDDNKIYITCDSNQLTSLDLSKFLSDRLDVDNVLAYYNAYSISVDENNQFDLTNLPGDFDVTKATITGGGSVSGKILTMTDGTISYNYNCGHDITLAFTLNVVNARTITLDANNGSGTTDSVKVANGNTYTLPACDFTAPTNKHFAGWSLDIDGDVINVESIKVTADVTLHAIWEDIPAVEYNITVTNGTSSAAKAAEGETITITANTAPDGQRFKEWQVVSNNVTLDDAAKATTTFTMPANAVEVKAIYEDIPAVTCTITVSANPPEGGVVTGGGTYESGEEATVSVTTNSGYVFKKWTENDVEVSTATSYKFVATGDRTLVAVLEREDTTTPGEGNEGSGDNTGGDNEGGDTSVTPPEGGDEGEGGNTPSNPDDDNPPVTPPSDDDDPGDVTPPSKPTATGSGNFSGSYNYPVSTPTADNGAVELSDSNAVAGETVTITTKPDKGYGAAEVIVTDKDGNEIEVTALGNGQYTFVMPEGGVDVQVVYESAITLTVGSLYIDVFGELVKNDVSAVLTPEGRMMLPIRVIAEALGADVAWDGELQKVTITKGDTIIEIFIGADYAIVNGEKVALDSAAFIKDGRTYLPVRFISEVLNADVNWYADSKTVTIVPHNVK